MKTKNSAQSKNKTPILTIFVCVLLSLILIFGAVFGIINLVKYTRAVAYYGDTYISEGEMNFLSSYYKFLFMTEIRPNEGVSPYDTPAFWEKTDKNGVKYGDRLKAGFKEYVSGLLTAAAIYDSAISFSGDNKEQFNTLCDEALLYLADGSAESFNEAVSQYGFDWDDFKSANVLLYKSSMAKSALYGADGSNLILEDDLCMEYLETYTRVDLLFIRLEDKFVLDENGNLTYNDENEVITEPLTQSEITERQGIIDTINSYITDGRMSPETFSHYQKNSDGDKNMYSVGYYLNPYAETTAEFAAEFPEIVNAAYEMEIGGYKMVECEAIGGVCFLYREAVAAGAYASESNLFFSDFYSDAADYLFPKTLKDLAVSVTFKDSFDEAAIISIPKNNKYYLKSFQSFDN